MNLLTPPTDSFYKFLGVGGLILFITCGIFIFSTLYKDDYKLTLAEGELNIHEYKLKEIIDDLKYLPQFENVDKVTVSKLEDWVNNLDDPNYSNDTLLTQSYYSLPDSIRKKISTLIFLNVEKQLEYRVLKERIGTRKDNEIIVAIGFIIGEIIAIVGIFLWYYHLQLPLDEERKNQQLQKRFSGTDLSKSCHSCSMTFYFNHERGEEKDGKVNRFFCKECYDKGKYIEPDLTFEEARKRFVAKLQAYHYSSVRIKKEEKKFKNLLRWKRQRNW